MSVLKLSGTIFSGSGQGKRFVGLPWVKRQLIEKTGFTPFLGTLNIRLSPESTLERNKLENLKAIEVKPQAGYFKGVLFRAKLGEEECFIVVPKVPNYPKEIIEIISSDNLRKKLRLKDGDTVTLEVTA
jgi:riboflavin kinase